MAHKTTHLRAGAAAVDITPSTPQWLDGYGGRTAPAESAYQAITVRALALRDRETTALLLSAEVLGFDRARVAGLKARIAEETGVPAEAVVLAATHTHCAPRVCDMIMPGSVDPEYVAWFEARCVEAAARACESLRPARLSFSRTADRLGINRRVLTDAGAVMRPNPEGTRDRDVDTLWFEDAADGRAIASLTVAACHPTCRGGEQIGGDYPGFLTRELEAAVGGVAMFMLGCAGDVRPAFTENGRFRMAALEEVEAAGQAMAQSVLDARSRLAENGSGTPHSALRTPSSELRVGRRVMEAPLAELPDGEALSRMAAEDPSPLRREWAERLLRVDRDALPRSIPFELQALAIGPGITVVFWPGEVVSDYALWLKQEFDPTKDPLPSAHSALRPPVPRVPAHSALVSVAYANGAVGYVPSARIYPEGGYEVNGSHPYYNLPAPYAPGVDELLKSETRKLLDSLNHGAETSSLH